MKQRILFITSNTCIGGQEVALKRLLKHIDGNLYRKDVLVTNKQGPLHDEYEAYSDNLFYAQELRGARGVYAVLFNLIREHNYDIIHFFNLWVMYNVIIRIKRVYPKIKVVTTLCVDLSFHKDWFAKDIRYMEKIQPHLWASITDAEINLQVLPDVTVIRNGVSPVLFKPSPKKSKTVVWLSRMIKEKRAHIIPKIARRLPEYHFIMIGDRKTEVYDKIIEDQPPNLELKIELSEEEVADILSDTQYFLFTSISEALPLTIMEAMSSECCVISEPVGDIPTMLIDGFNGHLIPEDADLVDWVSENLPQLDLSVTENARQTILDGFTIDQTAKKYEFIYGNIGSHGEQPRLAFLWQAPDYRNYWSQKIDAMQNSISKLSNDNVVQIFTTIEVFYHAIEDKNKVGGRDFYSNEKKNYRKIINGQNIFFCNYKDHREFIIELRKFNPDMIFMHVFHQELWERIARAFPDTWKSIAHFGATNLSLWTAKDLDMIFVQQEYLREQVALNNGCSLDCVRVTPYGVKTDIFKPLDTEKTYTGVMLADFRYKVKRQHLLVEAWKDIPGRLLLIGRFERSLPPEYINRLISFAQDQGVSDRVDFLDSVPHGEVPALINQAKIAFLTSAWEGGSIALMEMMACGLPAIVLDDCHGNTNRVKEGIDSLIAAPTIKDIAETTNRLLEMDWREMGRAASERVHREFRYDNMYDIYRDLVERVMEEKRCLKSQ